MAALGFGLFLASVPLAVVGLFDPKPARSNIILATAILAVPAGLLTASL